MDDFGSGLVKYSSFIYLGLSVMIGYVLLRVYGSKNKDTRETAEDRLARELEELRAAHAPAAKQADPALDASGLEGPAYTEDERAALDAARAKDDSHP
jgi:hypothetical protein